MTLTKFLFILAFLSGITLHLGRSSKDNLLITGVGSTGRVSFCCQPKVYKQWRKHEALSTTGKKSSNVLPTPDRKDASSFKPDHLKNISKVQKAQNLLTCVVTNSFQSRSHIHFSNSSTEYRVNFKTANITFHTLHSCQPDYLFSATRSLKLSNTNLLSFPFVCTSLGTRSFSVAGPKICHSLPPAFHTYTFSATFCHHLKIASFPAGRLISLAPSFLHLRFKLHWPFCTFINFTYLLTYLPTSVPTVEVPPATFPFASNGKHHQGNIICCFSSISSFITHDRSQWSCSEMPTVVGEVPGSYLTTCNCAEPPPYTALGMGCTPLLQCLSRLSHPHSGGMVK